MGLADVVRRYLLGISISLFGITVSAAYFGYEYVLFGTQFSFHMVEDLYEHITILILTVLFPLVGFIVERSIEERRRFEAALREQSEFVSSILNTVDLGIFTISFDGRILSCNRSAEEMFAYEEGGMVGRHLRSLFARDSQAETVLCAVDERGRFDGEVELRRSSGDVFPAYLSIRQLLDAGGRARALMGVARDITLEKERERLERQVYHAEKLASIGQLAAGVAHEINNPLTSVALITGQLLREVKEESVLKKLRIIEEQVEGAARIARSLLNFARQVTPQIAQVEINTLIERVVDELELQMKDIVVRKSLSDVPPIMGDELQLRQVFINILLNAVQAINGAGEIRISTWSNAGEVFVRICDTGMGIPEEHLTRIFEPFFTTRELGEGTGLGLAIAHGIVERHGGRIEVDSRPGEGSCFTVVLPQGEKYNIEN
ncbi:two-component system sensor histidine kinase NtrB [Candidatus Pyrohabitans sp.]